MEALRDLLEEADKSNGSHKKGSVQKHSVSSLGWGNERTKSFESIQEQLRTSVKLPHKDPSKELYIFPDDSERYWAGVATQYEPGELFEDVLLQRQEPLALSGAFTGPEVAWNSYEK